MPLQLASLPLAVAGVNCSRQILSSIFSAGTPKMPGGLRGPFVASKQRQAVPDLIV